MNYSLSLLFLLFLFGCSTLKTRQDPSRPTQKQIEIAKPSDKNQSNENNGSELNPEEGSAHPLPNMDNDGDKDTSLGKNAVMKLGIILGPGGAKTYAHIGFLKELQRRKIPVHMMAGLEWAALPAALYASKGYVNDVEWQMFKLKEQDLFSESLLSKQKSEVDLTLIQSDLNKIFNQTTVDSFKIKFTCAAWNLEKKQTFLMNRGKVSQLLPFCLGYPPLFRPYQKNVSAIQDIKSLSDFMRSKGVTYVLFVNVLEGMPTISFPDDLAASVSWNEASGEFLKKRNGIDEVISLNMKDFSFIQFDKKREIMQEGQRRADSSLNQWANQFGY